MMEINRLQPLECRQVRKLLDDFLSDELSVEVSRQILSHLDGCPGCGEEKAQRVAARELLRRAWNSVSAPPSLTDSIRILVEAETPRLSWMRLAAGFAVAFVGLAALVFMLTWFAGTESLAVDHFAAAIQDHLRCSGKPVEAAELPLDPDYPRLRQAIETLPQGYSLVGVMECEVGEARFVHYLFRGEKGALLSVMLEPKSGGQRLARRGDPVRVLDLEARSVEMGPLTVTGTELADYFIYLIGDGLDQRQSVALAEILVPILKEALG